MINEMVQYDGLREIIKYKIRDLFPFLAGILFVCQEAVRGVIRHIPTFSGQEEIVYTVQDVAIFVVIVLSYLSIKGKRINIWPIYFFVFSSIVLSYLIHPEYSYWFNHVIYGVNNIFFHFSSSIFGLLVFSLFKNKTKIITMLVYACQLNLLYFINQYRFFMHRGYWEAYLGNGILTRMDYGLNYGYNVAICAVFFLALYVYNRKIVDLVLFLIAFYLVIMGGSRGPILCIFAEVVILYFLFWKSASKSSLKFYLMLVFLIITLFIIATALPLLISGLTMLLSKTNISSRTVQMFLEGTIANDSGRNIIYQIATEMISKGGPFGYGFYGDRYIIGKTWFYGYPHNIFLELLIQYGWLLGGIIIAVLLYNIIRMFLMCTDKSWQFLLVSMFCPNVKLWLSDSFWYYWPFWALLAVIALWNKDPEQALTKRLRFRWRMSANIEGVGK